MLRTHTTTRRFALSCAILVALVGAGLIAGRTPRPGTAAGQPGAAADRAGEDAPVQCGHWAVYRALKLSGVPVPLDSILVAMPARAAGHSFEDLSRCLAHFGVKSEGQWRRPESLERVSWPAIAHVARPRPHFLVVAWARDDLLSVFDGQGRRQLVVKDDFLARWSGKLLVVRPSDGVRVAGGAAADGGTAGKPVLRFDKLVADQGLTPVTGKEVEFAFDVRNDGARPLTISRVDGGQRCRLLSVPAEPIPAGGKVPLRLSYEIQPTAGAFVFRANVHSNDPVSPVVQLEMYGTAATAVNVTPRPVLLTRSPGGGGASGRCFLHYNGPRPLVVRQVGATTPGISARYEKLDAETARGNWPGVGAVKSVPANTYVIHVTAASTENIPERGAVSVATNIAGYEEIVIPVEWHGLTP